MYGRKNIKLIFSNMTHIQVSCSISWRSAWTQHVTLQRPLPFSIQHFTSVHLFHVGCFPLSLPSAGLRLKMERMTVNVIKEYIVLKCDAVCFG